MLPVNQILRSPGLRPLVKRAALLSGRSAGQPSLALKCQPLGLNGRSFNTSISSQRERFQPSNKLDLRSKSGFSTSTSVSSNHEPNKEAATPVESASKKLTLKELIKKYGLSAFIVYNGLSLVDLSATFSLLYFGGDDQVLYIESLFKSWAQYLHLTHPSETAAALDPSAPSVKPSAWTTFAVAYSIHKLLIPIRVPLTAMLTPPFSRKLQALGWLKPKQLPGSK